jgi:hypothetical protein
MWLPLGGAAAGGVAGGLTSDDSGGALRGALTGLAAGGGAALAGGKNLAYAVPGTRQAKLLAHARQRAAGAQPKLQRAKALMEQGGREATVRAMLGAGAGLGGGYVASNALLGGGGQPAPQPAPVNYADPAAMAYYQQMGYL